jgi:hypothetical protein
MTRLTSRPRHRICGAFLNLHRRNAAMEMIRAGEEIAVKKYVVNLSTEEGERQLDSGASAPRCHGYQILGTLPSPLRPSPA